MIFEEAGTRLKRFEYQAFLNRFDRVSDKQTIGTLQVFQGLDRVFECKTLELPWRCNEPFISCIPKGEYVVQRRISENYGRHWHILNVRDRSLILIHWGNYVEQTEGCILVGQDFYDINHDGLIDVTSSRRTMLHLNRSIPEDEFYLKVA